MKITTADGAVFEAPSAKAVVALMRQDDWGAPPKKQEYMIETADRVRQIIGVEIRTTSPVDFLVDLEKAGFCQIEFLTPVQAAQFADAGAGTAVANPLLPDIEDEAEC